MRALPTGSEDRKRVPMATGCLGYFPAALVGVAKISFAGNEKHNKGQPLHHARGKSNDHADCVLRHLTDVQELLAAVARADGSARKGTRSVRKSRRRAAAKVRDEAVRALLEEASCLSWRALALSQELHERFGGAPLAPSARE